MGLRWLRKTSCIGAIVIITVLITGCPVPLPSGYNASSRENLGVDTKGRLEIGASTREDILLLLGEPDVTGADEAWFAYDSAYRRGGVVFLFCAYSGCIAPGGEKMQYQRLVVNFDKAGRMTNADFVDQKCWEGVFLSDSAPVNSVDLPTKCMPHYPSSNIESANDSPNEKEIASGSGVKSPTGGNQEIRENSEEIFIPKDLLDFAKGKAELITPGWISGFSAGNVAASNAYLAKELHDSEKWQALARRVLNDNYGDDLRWYFLGRSAEGMRLCDAAELYYNISKERSQKFVTRCLGIGIGCVGIKLPAILEERFSAIETMRSTNKCSRLENIDP